MSKIFRTAIVLRARLAALFGLALVVGLAQPAQAQFFNGGGGLFGNRVGGVSIDAAGMVTPPDKSARIPMRDALRKLHAEPAAELKQPVEMRMISLRRLEEAVKAAAQPKAELLADELRFLAGLQRIRYILVYPEDHDI